MSPEQRAPRGAGTASWGARRKENWRAGLAEDELSSGRQIEALGEKPREVTSV